MSDTEVTIDSMPTADVGPAALGSGDPSPRDPAISLSEILSFIATESRLATLPDPWGFVEQPAFARELPCDRFEFARILWRNFPVEALVAARILRVSQSGPALSRVLGRMDSIFFLEADADNRLTDIISARGRVSCDEPPCFRALREKPSAPNQEFVLLAGSDDDLLVLQGLGLSCAPSAGLESLTGKQVRRFFSQATPNSPSPKLRLVCWQVANLVNRPSQIMEQVLDQLKEVSQVFGDFKYPSVEVWWPADEDFARVKAAVRFEDSEVVRKCIEHSLREPMIKVDEARWKLLDHTSVDLPTARAELRRALDRARDFALPGQMRRVVEQYRLAYRVSVLDKFDAAVETTTDPISMTLQLCCRELTEAWFEDQPIIQAAEQVIAGNVARFHPVLDDRALAKRLQLTDEIMKISHELKRYS